MSDIGLFLLLAAAIVAYVAKPYIWIYYTYHFSLYPVSTAETATSSDRRMSFVASAYVSTILLLGPLLIIPATIYLLSSGVFDTGIKLGENGEGVSILNILYSILALMFCAWGFFRPKEKFGEHVDAGDLDSYDPDDAKRWFWYLLKNIRRSWGIFVATGLSLAVSLWALYEVIV